MSTLKRIVMAALLASTVFAIPAGCDSSVSSVASNGTGQVLGQRDTLPDYDYVPGDRM